MTPDDFPKTPKDFFDYAKTHHAEMLDLKFVDMLGKYERGTFLIEHCRGVLAAAEKQIELLTKAADGSLEARPLSNTAAMPSATDNE